VPQPEGAGFIIEPTNKQTAEGQALGKENKKPKLAKIYYATRTHSQIAQVKLARPSSAAKVCYDCACGCGGNGLYLVPVLWQLLAGSQGT
jgi:hypothetical protein